MSERLDLLKFRLPQVFKFRLPKTEMVYCYYDGLSYSPGAFLKIDGFERKLLYCNAQGTWDVKDEPS